MTMQFTDGRNYVHPSIAHCVLLHVESQGGDTLFSYWVNAGVVQVHSAGSTTFGYGLYTSGDWADSWVNSDAGNPIVALDAFRSFQSGVKERCIEQAQFGDVTIVGNYRMLDGDMPKEGAVGATRR